MAVLEKIRSKTVFLIAIIGLALFAFIISDFIGKGRFSNHTPNEIGSVNGEEVPIDAFRQQVENATRQANGQVSSIEAAKYVWEQNVQQILLNQQIEKLGLSVEKDQILAILAKTPLAQNPQFVNEYGVFDANKFTNYLATLKNTNPQAYAQWKMQEDAIIEDAKQRMYFSLIRAGLGVTNTEAEMEYHQEKDLADISYVALQYSSIDDKSVKVTDSEIQDYIKKHEKQFKQDAYRNIQYIVVSEKPSQTDIETEKESLLKLLQPEVVFNSKTNKNDTIAGFAKTKNIKDFVDRHSDVPYDSTFVNKDNLRSSYADTLFNLPVGKVFGPYEEDGSLKLSRMIAKQPGGAVKASHILIAYAGSQAATPNTTRTKEEAKAKAEELLAQAKAAGADFAQLARENSEEPGAVYSAGDLGFFSKGAMVKPFEEFAFNNAVGTIGLVETDFGFHVVKVTDKAEAVNIATISRKVDPSEATINSLFSKVTNFEMKAAQNPKEFANIAKKSELSVLRADNLHKNDDQIIGLGSNRSIVQWLFQKDTKIGDIKKFTSGGNYIVAQLVKQGEEGISSVQDAAPMVKPILIREKKAAILKEKAKGNSLEAIASANKTEVKSAANLIMKNPTIIGEGREPKVVGAAFGLKQGQLSKPIDGENAVYVIQLTSATVAPALDNYKTYAETVEKLRTDRAAQGILKSLESTATIKENLSAFY
ncbi:peptidylprolyl isomerase [Capnocytophaga sp. oral taxon 324]|uniref:peptidylprolyl isomerase n=1 Tax=Capnocytophaga sp. oral taxon 324 TaxID=712211 RepID=UPI0002A23413|nr:peptidylprolyl isomerase [Capnocytophaga sp. oral taxon 324]EKY16347.1 PPIC-type PPIASE domain protein [Capnocytophaga sp. oral taxon 324 str. F0483]